MNKEPYKNWLKLAQGAFNAGDYMLALKFLENAHSEAVNAKDLIAEMNCCILVQHIESFLQNRETVRTLFSGTIDLS